MWFRFLEFTRLQGPNAIVCGLGVASTRKRIFTMEFPTHSFNARSRRKKKENENS